MLMGMLQHHVTDQIEEYLAGELALASLRTFKQHLNHCPACTRALRDAQESQACMELLKPIEAPPAPGPDFYFKVQRSIQKRSDAGWLGNLAVLFRGPRLAYPILFLRAGLVISVWSFSSPGDWADGVLGIPPARFSSVN